MTGPQTGEPDRMYVWCAFGTPSTLPDRLEIVACPGCAALIAADRVDVHLMWHRRTTTTERN